MCSHDTVVQQDTRSIHSRSRSPDPSCVNTTQQCNRILTPHSRHKSPDLHMFTQQCNRILTPHNRHGSPDTCIQTTQQCNRIHTLHSRHRSPDLHVFTQSNAARCSPHRVDPGVQTHDAAHNVRVFTCKVQQFVVYDMPTLTICPQSWNRNSTCILYTCVHSHVH